VNYHSNVCVINSEVNSYQDRNVYGLVNVITNVRSIQREACENDVDVTMSPVIFRRR
jgi:hypothetical protein